MTEDERLEELQERINAALADATRAQIATFWTRIRAGLEDADALPQHSEPKDAQ